MFSTPGGTDGRLIPWKPSQPAIAVAAQLVALAAVAVVDARPVGVDPLEGHVVHLEQQRAAGVESRGDQVLDHLLLSVDRDRPPRDELLEGDPVPATVEAQLDPVVDHALAAKAIRKTQLREQVDRALLEHAGANPVLDVVAAAVLEHDRVDALPLRRWERTSPAGPAPTIPTWVRELLSACMRLPHFIAGRRTLNERRARSS